MKTVNKTLVFAAICSASASLLHVGCIVFGASWYRFLGAGEQMAKMAEAGELQPTIVTGFLSLLLAVWSLYALSGAGVIGRLPLTRFCLCAISAIFLFRGIAFVFLMPLFPDNSLLFWLVSSSICLVFAGAYAMGTKQVWQQLSR